MPESALPPPPTADLTVPLTKTAAIIAAGQLGVFEALSQTAATPAELTERLGVDEVGVTRLADRATATATNATLTPTTTSAAVDLSILDAWPDAPLKGPSIRSLA